MPKGSHLKGKSGAMRQSYRGFDLFKAGALHTIGETRCYFRPNRISLQDLNDEQRNHIPATVIWPARDFEMGKQLVDAVLSMDLKQLHQWKSEYRSHHFGFEDYLLWLTSYMEKTGQPVTGVPGHNFGPAVKTCTHRDVLSRETNGPFEISCHVLHFFDDDAWYEITIRLRDTIMTRVVQHPSTGEYKITRHYPGRWRGLGLRPDHPLRQPRLCQHHGLSQSRIYRQKH